MNEVSNEFLNKVSLLIEEAKKNVKTTVNIAMAYTYFEIGRMIIEEEQNGDNRAEYGKYIIRNLSSFLTEHYGKGYSISNLKNFRQFYLIYSNDSIGQTMFSQFKNYPATVTERKFYLSWSHYLKLMRISNIEERHFYEIEAVKNDWSLSELKRQYDSSLYERLSLSKNKDEIMLLSQQGQIIEKPADAIKDPYVLEFLQLPELPVYSETELENKIIDHLQQFLLELSKGYTFVGRQVRLTFDEEHFKVDLVFFNRII